MNDYQNIQAYMGFIRIRNCCLQVRMRQENVYMVEYKRTEYCVCVCVYTKSFKLEKPTSKYPYIYSKTCLIWNLDYRHT